MKKRTLFSLLSAMTLSLMLFSCEKGDEENLKQGRIEYKTYPYEEDIWLEIVAQELTIDWGDGTIEHFSPLGEPQQLNHHYDVWSLKTIQISVDGMTYFRRQLVDGWDIQSAEKRFDELRFIHCSELQEIHCPFMGLVVLEIDKAESLTTLDCTFNKLVQLNLNGCPSLANLYCMNNHLINLNIDQCTVLKNLWCINNQLTALELNASETLTMLMCGNNRINSLNLSNYKTLQHLVCNYSNVFYGSGSGVYYIHSGKYLYTNYTNRQRSSFKSNDDGILQPIDNENKTKNPPLTDIRLSGCNALISMSCENNQVATIDVKGCTSLEYLSCKHNELTANVLNTIFESLPVSHTKEAEIRITGNPGNDNCLEEIVTNKGWNINK
ncbi:MAG: hypothetical protein LBP72_10055 [Dysgonamonadaceae bacterium]|jgi:hypothetical protein|nr:hypothetical protein [Dysgonamonadaceae bacterium]